MSLKELRSGLRWATQEGRTAEAERINENIDKVLRQLKRSMDKEGIMRELKERQYYEKPSDKKRKKSARARSRVKKEQRELDRGIM